MVPVKQDSAATDVGVPSVLGPSAKLTFLASGLWSWLASVDIPDNVHAYDCMFGTMSVAYPMPVPCS
ncbi:hypothetical protein EWM64_g4333 [Hericium alpestre]|uniref:Uncharacterized protein n=1 Tax=Hericium alpestre TaxID=135208 RepID=A0A4Y9ZZT7_9AGAM|nr:hypothetical protein EWM64_g4333 [Hericium alpestre]